MLQAHNTRAPSSLAKLFVSPSILLSSVLMSSSNSKKMEKYKNPDAVRPNPNFRPHCQSEMEEYHTPDAVPPNRNFRPRCQSASLGKSSSNNKLGPSSAPSLIQRSKSPSSIKSQQTISAGPTLELDEGPFDICRLENVGPVKLVKPLHILNREKRKELERIQNARDPQFLRPGMVLLKFFINHRDQVKIVNKCRELGIGPGGFYRPGYRDGAKLHLQMMCLGKDWNPESRSYNNVRVFDGSPAPEIPDEFRKLVDEALRASHEILKQKNKNAEEIPLMSPDICIVNFYSNVGRLGLHQDRDESIESLKKGLPVVSFSIGDSAEFLYSDTREADKAEKVILESGDVLIFGGNSRHIFHGISSIKPDTAPSILTTETKLRPGRLNLTFRQY